MDGREVLSRIREWSQVPVIVLSVRFDEQDKIDALDRGADDYVTKPFGMGELLARMRNALRHRAGTVEELPLFSPPALRARGRRSGSPVIHSLWIPALPGFAGLCHRIFKRRMTLRLSVPGRLPKQLSAGRDGTAQGPHR